MKIFFKNKFFFLTLIFFNLINTKNLKKYSKEQFDNLKSSLSTVNSNLFERKLKELNCFFLEKKFKDLLKNDSENASLIYLNRNFKINNYSQEYCVGYFCKKKELFYIDIKFINHLIKKNKINLSINK